MTHINHKEWLTLPLSVVIAGGCIGLGIYLGGMSIGGNQIATSAPTEAVAAPVPTKAATGKPATVTSQDHIRGNTNAKAIIVEYSDLECPYCKQFHSTLKTVTSKYSASDVAWVYRHFPLPMHDKAPKEAEATECAADQGGNAKFWAYTDRLFEVSPTNNRLDPSELPKIAAYVGLDVEKFEKCLSSGKFTAKIAASVKEGAAAGASGTPYSVIITKSGVTPVGGAISAAALEQKINQALGR